MVRRDIRLLSWGVVVYHRQARSRCYFQIDGRRTRVLYVG